MVDAIGHATEAHEVAPIKKPAATSKTELPTRVRKLFTKLVVAVHSGAGNVMEQWSESHFSDLLIERHDVNVLLIGGPDDTEVADRLLASLSHPARAASTTGKSFFTDLPRLLVNCVLLIGNGSGPKHIAAAAGISQHSAFTPVLSIPWDGVRLGRSRSTCGVP
ncbi:glycosyltransferase family 9 protein [Rhodopila sp.]|uniref:glycosyltransferase family 9 protein n=1 Tax=Rhodopila sp. TaxID=2480087 RepID=UPI002C07D069|nr:glycosyltransferase family 9 protein [Rhodopila sp.]HVZ10594.1 glycosyltransferase family 9 protein [Rhodopila sp.]